MLMWHINLHISISKKISHAPMKEHDRLTEEKVQIAKIRSSQCY